MGCAASKPENGGAAVKGNSKQSGNGAAATKASAADKASEVACVALYRVDESRHACLTACTAASFVTQSCQQKKSGKLVLDKTTEVRNWLIKSLYKHNTLCRT